MVTQATKGMQANLDIALAYADMGWSVIPLHTPVGAPGQKQCSCREADCGNSAGKHPRIKDWPNQAVTDAQTIQEWWRRWPNANIGIATGEKSGITVIDVDGMEGEATLNRLQQEHQPLSPTLIQKSGSGGYHLVFKFPKDKGYLIKNEVKFAPGLDVRTTGGQFVVEPSLHYSGNCYQWFGDLHDTPIADMPQWLLQIVIEASTCTEVPSSVASASGESIPEGQRNDRLFKMGCAIRRHGATQASIEAALLQENAERCVPPLSADEVREIATSAAKYDPTTTATNTPDSTQHTNPSPEDNAARKEGARAKAQKKLTFIARSFISRGDSIDNAIPAMQAENDSRFKSVLSIEDVHAIYADELDAFLPIVLNAADLRKKAFPEPRWAMPGFIAQGVTLLAGRPKMGKSYLALNIALAVGNGRKALSRIDCPQGGVLYASGVTEGSFPEFQERLNQILREQPTPSAVEFVEDMPRLDQGGIGFLRHWARKHPDARLIIHDTLAAFEPRNNPRNSDGYAEAYSTMELLKQVAREFNLSILVITHTNKGTGYEWALDAVMGSTGNTGATDATLVMSKEGEGYTLETFGRRIKNEKYLIKPDLQLGLWELLEKPAEEHLMSQQRKAVIDVLAKESNEPIPVSEIADCLGKFEPKEKGAVRKLCWDMKRDGVLESEGGGRNSKYKLTDKYYTATDENQGNESNEREGASDGADSGSGFRYSAQSNSSNESNEKPSSDIKPLLPLLSVTEDGNETKHNDSKASDAFVTTVTAVTAQAENQAELDFVKQAFSQFGHTATPIVKFIPVAQTAGYDLTAEDKSPLATVKRIVAEIAGKELDGLKFRSVGDELYAIATVASGRERIKI